MTVPDVQGQRDMDKEEGDRDKGRKRDKETGTWTEGHGEGHRTGTHGRKQGNRDRDRWTKVKDTEAEHGMDSGTATEAVVRQVGVHQHQLANR